MTRLLNTPIIGTLVRPSPPHGSTCSAGCPSDRSSACRPASARWRRRQPGSWLLPEPRARMPGLVAACPSLSSYPPLAIEPDIFETPAVEQAVHHDRQALYLRLPARR